VAVEGVQAQAALPAARVLPHVPGHLQRPGQPRRPSHANRGTHPSGSPEIASLITAGCAGARRATP
ncbi:MAG: hypothetical protein ACRDS9_11535, partial [Pseudonocardiaceae bacterium]